MLTFTRIIHEQIHLKIKTKKPKNNVIYKDHFLNFTADRYDILTWNVARSSNHSELLNEELSQKRQIERLQLLSWASGLTVAHCVVERTTHKT